MFPDYMKFLEYYKEVCTSNDGMINIVVHTGIIHMNRRVIHIVVIGVLKKLHWSKYLV